MLIRFSHGDREDSYWGDDGGVEEGGVGQGAVRRHLDLPETAAGGLRPVSAGRDAGRFQERRRGEQDLLQLAQEQDSGAAVRCSSFLPAGLVRPERLQTTTSDHLHREHGK